MKVFFDELFWSTERFRLLLRVIFSSITIDRFDVVEIDIEFDGEINCVIGSYRSFSVPNEPLNEDIDGIFGGRVMEV